MKLNNNPTPVEYIKSLSVAGIIFLCVLCLPMSVNASASPESITVGSKPTTDQILLGKMVVALLENNGFNCKDQTGSENTQMLRLGLRTGRIDIYMESEGLGSPRFSRDNPGGRYWKNDRKNNETVRLPDLSVTTGHYFLMRRDDALLHRIRSISDLCRYLKSRRGRYAIGINRDFAFDNDGIKEIRKEYGLFIPRSRQSLFRDEATMFRALIQDKVDVIVISSPPTAKMITRYKLFALEDDRKLFSNYSPAPVVRRETYNKFPELENILMGLRERLTQKVLLNLMTRVKFKQANPEAVAKEWLILAGLL